MKRAVLTEYSISAQQALKRTVKIAHVSDLHERRADDVMALLQQAKPDFIVITGDTYERYNEDRPHYDFTGKPIKRLFITTVYRLNQFAYRFTKSASEKGTEVANDFVKRTAKIAPVFMSLGNHEETLFADDYRFLKSCGIRLLDNADTDFFINGIRIRIGGLSPEPDMTWLEHFAQKDGFKLLLCHHPEFYDKLLADKNFDLILTGHTHGGQIRLFGKGLFAPYQGAFPKYDYGMFHNRMIISAGCSNTTAVPRLGNPRELVMINLTS